METARGYRVELDLNNEQITACKKHCGAARFAYNWALKRKQEDDKAGKKTPYAADLPRELNALKQSDYPWMYEVSKCAPQEALRHLDEAFKHFFRRKELKKQGKWQGKCGYPRFKSKHKGLGSCTFTGSIHVTPSAIQLPRLGLLKLKERDYLPMNRKIGSATISEQAGRWYVSICIHEEQAEPTPATGEVIGIDLGVKTLATLSERQIQYKAFLAGIQVILANRWEPSSKTCSECGWYDADLELADLVFVCYDCGYVADRDYNAAKNLADSRRRPPTTGSSSGSERLWRERKTCNARQHSQKQEPNII